MAVDTESCVRLKTYIDEVAGQMPIRVRENFRRPERIMLRMQLQACGLMRLPDLAGCANGERASGEMICDRCGRIYYDHPMDWRVIGYGDVPFLKILCDGRRVKL